MVSTRLFNSQIDPLSRIAVLNRNETTTRSGSRSDDGTLPRLLNSLTDAVSQHPKATLWIVALLTVISVTVTARFLNFKTNRSDLIDPSSEFHQRWLAYTEAFGDESDVLIVIEGENDLDVKNAIDAIGSKLDAEPEMFERVLARIEPGPVRTKALQYLSPTELENANQRLESFSPILEGHWSRAGLESYAIRLNDHILRTAESGRADELTAALQQTERFASSLSAFVRDSEQFISPWPQIVSSDNLNLDETLETRYQLTSTGKMGFVLATPSNVSGDFSGGALSIARMRAICREVQERQSGVRIGLTGIPILEADEMQRSQQDMLKASIISFVGVGLILLVGFRGFRHPCLALVMLAVGLAWSLGYTTLAVGHLNILSVSFAAILIGLGIDFAIHYLARYIELRHHNEQFHRSLTMASESVGTGIVTAAITTALAFFCATFTNFLGVAELGVIAGGGIILCAAATFVVLPALITIADQHKEPRQLPTPFQGNFLRRLTRDNPIAVSVITLIAIVAIGCQGLKFEEGRVESRVVYDANLLNLQAKGVESVELQRRIFQEANGSLLYAVSIVDSIADVRILKEEFLALPTVSRVEEMASFMPPYPPQETNLLVQAIHARLSRLSDLPREFPQLDPNSIGRALDRLYETLSARTEPEAVQAANALDEFLNALSVQELEPQLQILAGYQTAMLTSLHRQFQMLEEISDPEPITPDDFIPGIRERFVSDSGKWLLRIYPNEQIWEEEPLAAFVEDVRSVDPDATGTPLQNYEAARQIRESYFDAAIYALIVICLVLFIDALDPSTMFICLLAPLAVIAFAYSLRQADGKTFEPLQMICLYVGLLAVVAFVLDWSQARDALLTLLPPIAGGFLMFGMLGVLGIDLNPANLIVLPLILGIGVDDGVHVIHDARHCSGPYETSPSTINAITLTSLTSMAGFGSMVVAAHQGLVSLGQVLVIGVGSCLFVSLVTLPAILTLLDRFDQRRKRVDSHDSPVDDSADVSTIPMNSHGHDVA